MLKKSKKQKADYPRYDLVKAAEFFVRKLSIFLRTAAQYRINYYRLMRLFSPLMHRSGRLDCKETARSLLSASPAITIHSDSEKVERQTIAFDQPYSVSRR